jgi:hypothetical protein
MSEVEAGDMKTELQPPTESDEAILEQMEQIKNEIAETKPLVGRMVAISVLSTEYDVNDVIYQEKIQNLSTKYQKIRQIRPDGNCFFRAVLFAYLERLIHDPSDYARCSTSLFVGVCFICLSVSWGALSLPSLYRPLTLSLT